MNGERITVLLVAGESEAQNKALFAAFEAQTAKTKLIPILAQNGKNSPVFDDYAASHGARVLSGSIAAAFNAAKADAETDYLTILRAGDAFPKNYFEKMLKFSDRVNVDDELLEDEDEEKLPKLPDIPLICPKQKFAGGGVDRFSAGKRTVGVDLRGKKPVALRFPLTAFGVLFFLPTLEKSNWNESLSDEAGAQDLLFRLLAKHGLLLAADEVTYTYAAPYDPHFAVFPRVYDRDWYVSELDEWLLPLLKSVKKERGFVPAYLQAAATYLLWCKAEANRDNRNRRVLSAAEADEEQARFSAVLHYADDEIIDRVLPNGDALAFSQKVMFLQLKHNCFTEKMKLSAIGGQLLLSLPKKGCVPFGSSTLTPVNIQRMDYVGDALEIDGTIANVYGEAAALSVCVGGESFAPAWCGRFALTKYFGKSAFKQRAFSVSLPYEAVKAAGDVHFELTFDGKAYPLPLVFPSHFAKLTETLRHSTWRFADRVCRYDKQTLSLQIKKNKPLSGAGRECALAFEMLTSGKKRALAMLGMRGAYWVTRPFWKGKTVWFFLDKIYKGGDNAEYIYRFAKPQNDGIYKTYLIDKHAPEAAALKADGLNPTYRNTLRHYMAFLNADVVVASNSTVMELNHLSVDTSAYLRDLVHFRTACVQHGLSVQNIAAAQNRLRDNTALYFCAAPIETDNLSRPIYDYKGDELKLTGVPRFDGLNDAKKKQLLLSPTWRMQSAVTVRKNEGVQRDYNPHFRDSAYFKTYNALIHDKRLLAAAKRLSYDIVYVLHPIVSPQLKDFGTDTDVKILAATGDTSYEKLFCESALMITDYSGVQFDFAYMRKPLLYYLPDSLPKHYEEGAFKTEEMGFGKICKTQDDLVDALIDAMEHDCAMPAEYKARADAFFAYSDHENCKRIYDELLKFTRKESRK